jgi:hypothetical protein
MRGLRRVSAIILLFLSDQALAAGITECTQYANEAVATAQEVRDLSCGFDVNHPQWSQNREAHLRWCRNAEQSSVDHEIDARRRSIGFCRVCRAYTNSAVSAANDNVRLGCGQSGSKWSTDPAAHFNWCMGLQDYSVQDLGLSTIEHNPGSFAHKYLEAPTGERVVAIERCKIQKAKQPLQASTKTYSPDRERFGASASTDVSKVKSPDSLAKRRSKTQVESAKLRKSDVGKELRSSENSVRRSAPCVGGGHPCASSRSESRSSGSAMDRLGGGATSMPDSAGAGAASRSRPTAPTARSGGTSTPAAVINSDGFTPQQLR